jgi:hypothetical protein
MSPAELSSAGRVFTSVGYSIGFDWGETATWDQGCALYPDPEGVMLTDCSFTSGASGGPILMRNSEGTLRIVGLIQGMLGVRPRFRWGEQRFRVFSPPTWQCHHSLQRVCRVGRGAPLASNGTRFF